KLCALWYAGSLAESPGSVAGLCDSAYDCWVICPGISGLPAPEFRMGELCALWYAGSLSPLDLLWDSAIPHMTAGLSAQEFQGYLPRNFGWGNFAHFGMLGRSLS